MHVNYEGILKALKEIDQENKGPVKQQQGVMTDVGPGNAKAYTAILGGKDPEEAGGAGGSAGGPDSLAGITQPGYPSNLTDMTNEELRQLANILQGKKKGQKGAVGKRTKRDELLKMVFEGMGGARGATSLAGISPPSGSSGSPPTGSGPATTGGAEPPERDPSKPWNSRGFSNILASPPPPGSTEVTPSLQRSVPGQEPTNPFADESFHEAVGLKEAIKRLTESIEESNRKYPTVAEEVSGLSLAERMERLKKAGHLLSEDETKLATLKDNVTPRDIVGESERREQRRRDEEAAGKKLNIGEAGKELTRTIGSATSGFVTKVAGPAVGEYVGRKVENFVQPWIERHVEKSGGTVAGKAVEGAAEGAVGVAARNPQMLRAIASNPITIAVAVTAAMIKLPGIVERFATSVAESQRQLAKYNAQMASTYARMDYQKRLLEMQTAGATSGTSATMNRELMELRKETQWMRETWANTKNVVVTLAVEVARGVNFLNQYLMPELKLLALIMQKLNEIMGGSNLPNAEIINAMRAMSHYTTPEVRNRKPQQLRNGDDRKDGRDSR